MDIIPQNYNHIKRQIKDAIVEYGYDAYILILDEATAELKKTLESLNNAHNKMTTTKEIKIKKKKEPRTA
jgi:hypothetical protein